MSDIVVTIKDAGSLFNIIYSANNMKRTMIVFRMRIIPIIIVIADLLIGITINSPGVFADTQRDDGTDCPGSRRRILPTNCIPNKRGKVIVNYNENNNNLIPGNPDQYRPGGSNVYSRPPYPVTEFVDDEDESFDTSFDFDDWRRARAQRRGTKFCENKGGKRGVVNVNYYENGNGPQPGAEPPRPAPEIFDDDLPPVLGPPRPAPRPIPRPSLRPIPHPRPHPSLLPRPNGGPKPLIWTGPLILEGDNNPFSRFFTLNSTARPPKVFYE